MLCGSSPFDADSEDQILRKIALGEFSFEGENWDKITKEAKDFITNMLQLEPENRRSAEEILKHPWLKIKDPWNITKKTQITRMMLKQTRKQSIEIPKTLKRRHTLSSFELK